MHNKHMLSFRSVLGATALAAGCFAAVIPSNTRAAPSAENDGFNTPYMSQCEPTTFEVSKKQILSALRHPDDSEIVISNNFTCETKYVGPSKFPKQEFRDKNLFGVVASVLGLSSDIQIFVANPEYRTKIKAIHLFNMRAHKPHKVFSYFGGNDSNSRVATTHYQFGSDGHFVCRPILDYIVVFEWREEFKQAPIAYKFRVRNAPVACDSV